MATSLGTLLYRKDFRERMEAAYQPNTPYLKKRSPQKGQSLADILKKRLERLLHVASSSEMARKRCRLPESHARTNR